MHRELVVLLVGLVIGSGITFGILLPVLGVFWRQHDRKVAAQIDKRTARMDLLREEW